MTESCVTPSPQTVLADLYLAKADFGPPQLGGGGLGPGMEGVFSKILDNKVQRADVLRKDAQDRAAGSAAAAGLGLAAARVPEEEPELPPASTPPEPSEVVETASRRSAPRGPGDQATDVRRSSVEELEDQVESLGLPLDILKLDKDDLGLLAKVLEDSGYSDGQIKDIFGRLAEGPLTMDRVMALITSAAPEGRAILTVGEDSRPFIGQFLQDLGFNPEEVKSILDNLQAGEKLTAADLREMLGREGLNLNDTPLSRVDRGNLEVMLKSLGMEEADLNKLMDKMEAGRGRLSLDGFLEYMQSLEKPDPLTRDQLARVNSLVKNMLLTTSLRPTPYFNRITALLQSMGDPDIDDKFMSDSPAVQALRGGAASAQKVTQGTGTMGRGSGGEQGGLGGRSGNQGPAGQPSSPVGQGQGGQAAGEGFHAAQAAAAKNSRPALEPRQARQAAQQVADKMVFQAKNGQNRVRIHLNPPDLGRVNINISVRNNEVSATISAENPGVRAALEEHVQQLRQTLAEQGLELGRFDVNDGGSRQADSGQGREGGARSRRPGGGGSGPEPEEQPQEQEADAERQQGRVYRIV